jgi:hypothetical protein
MACGNNDVSRDQLASAPSAPSKQAQAFRNQARQSRPTTQKLAPKLPVPKAFRGPWSSAYNQRGQGEIEVMLDKQGKPTQGMPHVHLIHEKDQIRMHISVRDKERHHERTTLPGTASGNEVNAAVDRLIEIMRSRWG